MHVELALVIDWDDTVELISVEKWGLRSFSVELVFFEVALNIHVRDD